ncbi:MAG: TRAP transporter small permease [Lautropia sp.]
MHDADTPARTGLLAGACAVFERIAMALVVVMTALILVQVAGRNLFDAGLPWAEELARYAGLGVVYLAVPLLLHRNQHIRVDMLEQRLHGRAARALRLANEVVVLAFCGFFLWGGWLFLKRAASFSTAALGIPNWLYYLPPGLGLALLTLVAVARFARALAGGSVR